MKTIYLLWKIVPDAFGDAKDVSTVVGYTEDVNEVAAWMQSSHMYERHWYEDVQPYKMRAVS